MASSIALRRLTFPTLFARLHKPARCASIAPSLSCSFNTDTQLSRFDEDDSDVDIDRRCRRSFSRRRLRPGFYSDVVDPFSSTRSISQVLNLMDQFMENSFVAASQGLGAGYRRGWDVKEDENGLYIRMDMPGLGKENVKVSVEQNTLKIRGEAEKESEEEEEEEEGGRRYSSRQDLPPDLYKLDSVKAEMKNGILKVVVPKVKEEERKDVIQVKVD